MNIYIKHNIEKTCRVLLQEKIGALNVMYIINSSGSVHFPQGLSTQKLTELEADLDRYGIEIITDHKIILVQKIKNLITDMLKPDGSMPLVKISSYLADNLNESYRTLSQIFTEVCHISIESFIIFHKTEIVKQLLLNEGMTLTEISHLMQYSSVAHLSNQFKNSTGLNPSAFQKVASSKRKVINNLS